MFKVVRFLVLAQKSLTQLAALGLVKKWEFLTNTVRVFYDWICLDLLSKNLVKKPAMFHVMLQETLLQDLDCNEI